MRWRGVVLFVSYQAAWWGAALLARDGRAGLAVGVMLAFAAVALATDARRPQRAAYALATLAVGVVVDGALRAGGVLSFPAALDGAPSPPFMMAIWIAFSFVLPIPYVSARPLVSALAGALGGPLAYRGGAALGVLSIAPDGRAWAALALAWACALPLLGWLARELEVEEPNPVHQTRH